MLLLLMQMQNIPRQLWLHPFNDERVEKGEFYKLYPDLRHYPQKFFRMYCMNVQKFDYLLVKLKPHLRKGSTNYRSSISAKQQLVLTLT